MKKTNVVLFTAIFTLLTSFYAFASSISSPVNDFQTKIYHSFKTHLNMGKSLEAAKIYVAAEFDLEPQKVLEDYFSVKFYRMNDSWRAAVEEKIRTALSTFDSEGKYLKDFTVHEEAASFTYTQPEEMANPNQAALKEHEETAYLIADAVFSDVPEIEVLNIRMQTPETNEVQRFDFIRQI